MNKRNARLETKPSETDWIPVTSSAGNSACRSFDNSLYRDDGRPWDFSFKRSELQSKDKSRTPIRLQQVDRRSEASRSLLQANLLNFEARDNSRLKSTFGFNFSGLGFESPRGGSAFKVDSGRHPPAITPFEDPLIIKLEDCTDEMNMLQKRRPGRPRKEASSQLSFKLPPAAQLKVHKPVPIDVQVHENYLDFYSDGEHQSLEMKADEVNDTSIRVFFGPTVSPQSISHAERLDPSRKFTLDFKKIIDSINHKREKEKVQRFICRFCGKAFDKPSSLGGHTAKTHNGLSLKYKNRVEAAKNRKAERSRTRFFKSDAEKLMLDTTLNNNHP